MAIGLLEALCMKRNTRIVEKCYDKVAGQYYREYYPNKNLIAALNRFDKMLKQNSIILDAGCGAALHSARILTKRHLFVGVDISQGMLNLAKKDNPKALFMKKDVTRLDFTPETFDGICSFFVIVHLKEPEIKSMLESFHKALKNKGVLLLSAGLEAYDEYSDFLGSKTYWGGIKKDELIKMLHSAGFRISWEKVMPFKKGGVEEDQLFIIARKV